MIVNTMMTNQNLVRHYRKIFDKTFGVGLTIFFDLMRGFYLNKFKAHMGNPTDLKQYVEEKYGTDAYEMIEELISNSYWSK